MKYSFLLFFFIFNTGSFLFAQFNPNPAIPCAGSLVTLTNPNPSGTSVYDWDFCTGDLLETPTATIVNNNIVGANRPEGFVIFKDEGTGNWHGFATNRNSGNLLRFDFGSSLNNAPSIVDLGTLGGVLSAQPMGVDIIKEGNNYYGIVACFAPAKLVIINFSTNLTNTPVVLNTPFTNATLTAPHLIDAVQDGSQVVVMVVNNNGGFSIVDFGSTITNMSPTYTLCTPSTNVLRSISLIKDYGNNRWYGLTVSNNIGLASGVYNYLDFNNGLNQTPIITDITANFAAPTNPRQVKMLKDGKNFIAYVICNTPPSQGGTGGNLARLNFGTTMNNQNPILTNLGNLGMLGQIANANASSFTLTMAKQNSEWVGFVIDRLNGAGPINGFFNQLTRLNFPNNCNASLANSTDANPMLSFFSSGTYGLELDIYENTNKSLTGNYRQDITVQAATVGSFTISNQCLGESTIFNNLSVGDDANVSSWQWNFGNGITSNLKNPTLQYTQAGNYTVSLTVNNTSGCNNTITKTLVISSRPNAGINTISSCVGTPTFFENTSTFQTHSPATGATTFFWNFGNGLGNITSTNATQQTTYAVAGTYTVTLTVMDDVGCTSTTSRIVNVGTNKPTANFSNTTACVGLPTVFTDLSTVAGVGESIGEWNWKFGAAGTSTERNPSFTFNVPGTYTISLTVKSATGCQSSTFNKSIVANANLNSTFSVSDSTGFTPLTINFSNTTPNAVSFLWDFGDGTTNNTTGNPSHTYTAGGNYIVKFQALNSLGCGTIAVKTIKTSIITDLDADLAGRNKFEVLNIYPNPTSGFVKLDLYIPQDNQKLQFRIFDIHGRLMAQKQIENVGNGKNEIEIDFSNYVSGEYILILDTEKESIAKKIVVY